MMGSPIKNIVDRIFYFFIFPIYQQPLEIYQPQGYDNIMMLKNTFSFHNVHAE